MWKSGLEAGRLLGPSAADATQTGSHQVVHNMIRLTAAGDINLAASSVIAVGRVCNRVGDVGAALGGVGVKVRADVRASTCLQAACCTTGQRGTQRQQTREAS